MAKVNYPLNLNDPSVEIKFRKIIEIEKEVHELIPSNPSFEEVFQIYENGIEVLGYKKEDLKKDYFMSIKNEVRKSNQFYEHTKDLIVPVIKNTDLATWAKLEDDNYRFLYRFEVTLPEFSA